jgi:hypothetical protein
MKEGMNGWMEWMNQRKSVEEKKGLRQRERTKGGGVEIGNNGMQKEKNRPPLRKTRYRYSNKYRRCMI